MSIEPFYKYGMEQMKSIRLNLLVSCTLVFAPALACAVETPTKPNVLLIVLDDMNAWIGRLGVNPQTRTPNLDRLCDRGMLFASAHCAQALCNPSRTAMLTGQPPFVTGIYKNPDRYPPGFLEKHIVLPKYFSTHGYRSINAGKIFHVDINGVWDETGGFSHRESPRPKHRGVEGLGKFDWGATTEGEDAFADTKACAWIAKKLQSGAAGDKPFFMGLGIYRPHVPWYVPQKYFDQFPLDKIVLPKVKEDDLDDLSPNVVRGLQGKSNHKKIIDQKKWAEGIQAYLAAVSYADSLVGRVLDALDAGPYARNTIIVLVGDHGFHHGQKEYWTKGTLWEESTHVPLIIVAPKGSPGLPAGAVVGARCDRTVGLIDIYATLTELTGLPSQPGLASRSLVPLLSEPKTEWSYPAITNSASLGLAVRTERWRYIRRADGDQELYDHTIDPYEWNNLASDSKFEPTMKELAKHLPAQLAPKQSSNKGEGASR